MNEKNYYFLTGISAIIYKIYRLATGKPMIGKESDESSFADDFLTKPEYQDFIEDNVWNMGNSNPIWNRKN